MSEEEEFEFRHRLEQEQGNSSPSMTGGSPPLGFVAKQVMNMLPQAHPIENLPVIGAAVGAALAPGVGTAVGAGLGQIGARMGEIASGSPAESPMREAIAPMVQTAMAGIPEVGGVKSAIQGTAKNLARRSLGFTKGMLKRLPGGIERANDVGQTMLDEGVIKAGSGAEATLDRATDLADSSGKQIGEGLQAMDNAGFKSFNPKSIANKVYRQLKPQFSGGAYDAQDKAAREVSETILAHGKKPATFESAQALKKTLQDLGKFESMSNAMKAEMYRKASSMVRIALEDSVEQAAGSSFLSEELNPAMTDLVPKGEKVVGQMSSAAESILPDYLKAKKTYGAAEMAIGGLKDKVAGEASNSLLSLRGAAIGAGALASGRITPALEALGLWEAARRIGTGTGAAALNTMNNSPAAQMASRAAMAELIRRMFSRGNQNGQ